MESITKLWVQIPLRSTFFTEHKNLSSKWIVYILVYNSIFTFMIDLTTLQSRNSQDILMGPYMLLIHKCWWVNLSLTLKHFTYFHFNKFVQRTIKQWILHRNLFIFNGFFTFFLFGNFTFVHMCLHLLLKHFDSCGVN